MFKRAFLLLLLPFVLIYITACSSNTIKDVELVKLHYWENDGVKKEDEYLDEMDTIQIFVDAINNSEKLPKQKIIKTRPLLSISMEMENDETKNYHLWINEWGEGYIQILLPEENRTFSLDKNTIEKLTNFIEERDNIQIIKSKIEFTSEDISSTAKDTMNDEGVIIERKYVTKDGKTHFIIHNEPQLSKVKIDQITTEIENSYQEIKTYANSFEWEKEIHIYLKSQNDVSFAKRDEIILYNTRGDNYQLTHELTHTLLGFGDQSKGEFNPDYGYITQEGFTVYIAEKIFPEKRLFPNSGLDVHQVMKYIVDKGENIPISDLANNQTSLEYFRSSKEKDYWKSYIHAGSFVKYLFETFEKDKVLQLYNSPNLEADFKRLLGTEIQTVEDEWLDYLKEQIEPLSSEEKYKLLYP